MKENHCKEKIKSYDLFGHEVMLNIDKEPKAHKTLIGGCFSIIVLVVFSVYVGINIKRFLLKEGNNESTYTILS